MLNIWGPTSPRNGENNVSFIIYGFTNSRISENSDEFLFTDIQYEEMKAKLVMCIQEAPSPESVEPDHLTRYFAKFDEAFFTFCEKGGS